MMVCIACGAGMYSYSGYYVCPVCNYVEREEIKDVRLT